MSEDKEFSHLENEWKKRFDRFTAPEPSREQTLDLLQKIKGMEEAKPVDLRVGLETEQGTQSMLSKVGNLFLSQWNFHGARSWLLTGIVMLIVTLTISLNMGSEVTTFTTWIKWVTLIAIAGMGYAFRSKNEGNDIIETLSYHPLIQQVFARFVIVMTLQILITLPLSFMILGRANSMHYLLGSFTPTLFFGVVGFVCIIWLGQKIGIALAVGIWFGQSLLEEKFQWASLFKLPTNEDFLLMNLVVIGISCLLLSSLLLKNKQMRNLT